MNATFRVGFFKRTRSLLLTCVLFGCLVARTARAEEPTPVPTLEDGLVAEAAITERPWAVGVSPEKKQAARELFLQGNALLKEAFFKQAIDKYRQALTHWDHPGIHYNLALALINLDVPLEVRFHLLEAIKYGVAPLDEKKLEHGKNYLKLIENQLSNFELSTHQPNTTVILDGQRVLNAPGTYKAVLPPGDHHVVATRAGHVRRDYDVTLMPGKHQELTVRLFTEVELLEHRRRWPLWLPIAVTSAGVALAGTGFYFMYRQNEKIQQYNDATDKCDGPTGCPKQGSLSNMLDTADTYKTLSTVGLVASAATLTAGTIMLFMNLEKTRRLTPEERDRLARVQPMVTPHGFGIVSSTRF